MTHTRTLVIHPRDESTSFLQLAYSGIDATVVTGDIRRPHVRKLMEQFDRIMMLGHGSPDGLFSVGQFPDCQYIVDEAFVDQLRERGDSIFCWCYATQFMRKHRLRGLGTSMFVSEPAEARLFDLAVTDTEIQESNYVFANIVGRFADQHPKILHAAIVHEYGRLATRNAVANYNAAGIRLFSGEEPEEQFFDPRQQRVHGHGANDARIRQQYAEGGL